jgi:hypothetical protein
VSAPVRAHGETMTTIALRAWVQAKPFRPFRIKMADGTSHDVRHPDFIAYGNASHTCVVYGEGEELSILDLLLMTELRDIGQPADAGTAVKG